MNSLTRRFEAFLRKQRLVHRGNTVLIAVSGGADSMVMLQLFAMIRRSWKLNLHVVHVNHMLRGKESDGDEAFVHQQAKRLSIPFHVRRVDTTAHSKRRHQAKQEAARELRYRFFHDVVQKTNADVVATAHHANDNAETVLLNILRGAGVRGLAGIPLKRGYLVRPLLFASRHEIENYAKLHAIPFRDDSSNVSSEYRRNALRNRIIPALNVRRKVDVVKSLNAVSSVMREIDTKVERILEERFPETGQHAGQVELDTTKLLDEPEFIQELAILRLLRNAGIEPTEKKVRSVLGLVHRETGTQLHLGKHLTIFNVRKRLVIRADGESPLRSHVVTVGGSYLFPFFRFSASAPEKVPTVLRNRRQIEFVDAAKLGTKLVIRPWKPGDWFMPLGLRHKKKLSDFLVDEKIPIFEKSKIPVLEAHGEIVWVCGKRLDDRFKVTPTTRSVVRLTYRPNAHV